MGRGGSSSGGGSRGGGSRSSSSRSSSGSRGSFSSGRSRGYGGGSSSRSSSSSHRSAGSSSSGFGGPARGGMGGGPGYGPRGFGRPAGYGPMGPRRGYDGYGGYGYGGPRGGGGCGCFSGLLGMIALVVVLLIVVPSACTSSLRGCSSSSHSQSSNGSGQVELNAQPIETNTKREKLDAEDCVESSEWIDDQAGWLSNQDKVINAMQSFYNQTGVQPYLVIADEINGNKDYSTDDVEDYLRNLYDELYHDDGHLILLFCEPYENEYDPFLLVGEAAQQVVDTSGENIIYEAIDYWYTDSSLDDDAYFARIFVASANKLMYGTDFTEFG